MTAAAPARPAAATGGGEPCANCGAPLAGDFCHRCGQRDRDPTSIRVREWVSEWADHVFSLDARLWRTLRALFFSPGRLTAEYLAGRRVRWVSPLRLFLVSAVLAVFAGGVAGVSPVKIQTDEGRPLSEEERREALEEADDDLPELYRRLIHSDPEQLNRAFLGYSSQAVILLVPVFALALRLLYRRRYARYVPHLIFALHVHSFAFFTGAAAIGAAGLFGAPDVFGLVALLLIAVHLWQAQRRVYAAGPLGAAAGTVLLAVLELVAFLLLGIGLLLVVLWLAG